MPTGIYKRIIKIEFQKDISGQKFNKLKAIKFAGRKGKRGARYFWLFKCDCGKIKIAQKNCVIKGIIKSCGCFQKEWAKKGNARRSHNMTRTRFYVTYQNLKSRCNNKRNINYHNYGARGIKCFWNSFEEFKNDMYKSYQTHIKKFGAFSSSANPDKLALTIKAAIPLVIFGLGFFGYVKVTSSDLESLVTAAGLFVSAAFTLYGAGRKVFYAIKS